MYEWKRLDGSLGDNCSSVGTRVKSSSKVIDLSEQRGLKAAQAAASKPKKSSSVAFAFENSIAVNPLELSTNLKHIPIRTLFTIEGEEFARENKLMSAVRAIANKLEQYLDRTEIQVGLDTFEVPKIVICACISDSSDFDSELSDYKRFITDWYLTSPYFTDERIVVRWW